MKKMAEILSQLTALCVLAAVSEQLTADTRLRDGVQLITGILAARMMLEIIRALPGALFFA